MLATSVTGGRDITAGPARPVPSRSQAGPGPRAARDRPATTVPGARRAAR